MTVIFVYFREVVSIYNVSVQVTVHLLEKWLLIVLNN
jgi:hypothetical protein